MACCVLNKHSRFTKSQRSVIWLRSVIVQGIHDVSFLGFGVLLVLFLNSLHEFVHLADLLVCEASVYVNSSFRVTHAPLILSILVLSILSPFHSSPWRVWAYSCHSVRKPICTCQGNQRVRECAQLTICTGLSMSLCALNSALTYISPSTRSSTPSLFRCVLKMVL